ncbi:MAG: hypothetical protein A2X86_09780 [Bdellovibrionales bacterium GWA2_49_15]|nr:MAG: hypothetical protein A2X86_09780 [Bdellovibrionales bacterium GWA2_49_15]HAZ13072.1 hypothetical protein [Bdellovibrionales bacterium]
MPKFFLAFLLLFTLSACSSTRQKLLNPHAHVKLLPYWTQKGAAKPGLSQKVQKEIPGDILSYLRENNKISGTAETPAPFNLTKKEFAHINRVFNVLPSIIVKRLTPYIKGIYFVEHLGSSGFTEYIYDGQGLPLYAFMVFDRSILKISANEWCSRREQSPFQLVDGFKLSCTLENSSANYGAFLYLFLLELAHVLQINNNSFPLALEDQSNLNNVQETDFFKQSWLVENDSAVLQQPIPFSSTCNFKYSMPNPSCGPQDAFILYETLAKSSIPTGKAVVSPLDDFIESFANYVYTKMLKQPFEIELSQGDHKLSYSACWETPRCSEKGRIMSAILGRKE